MLKDDLPVPGPVPSQPRNREGARQLWRAGWTIQASTPISRECAAGRRIVEPGYRAEVRGADAVLDSSRLVLQVQVATQRGIEKR